MKSINNFSNVKAITGDYDRLPAGGYVCRIVKVEDYVQDERLVVYYDILDGDYANYWEENYKRYGKENWKGRFNQSYSEAKLGTFKAFIEAVDESNGTKFTDMVESGFDEQKLVRQKIGLVIGYKTYSFEGKTGETTYVKQKLPIRRIEDGDYKVPELWDAAGTQNQNNAFATLNTSDEDLPF